MEAQLRIREEAREQQDVLADLLRWQSQATKRSTGSSSGATRPAGPAVPGTQPGLAPLRGQRHRDIRKRPAAAAPHILRESANSAAQTNEGTAAKHTYDYFKDKWDNFDYDAAMADDDDENVTQKQAAAHKQAAAQKQAAEMQHQQQNWRKPNAPVHNKLRQQSSSAPEASDAELWKERGNKAFTQGAYADAKKSYTQSIALEPTCLAHANRAMSELKLMEFAAAEADCTQAIRLDPSYTKAYLRRASAFKALGKLLEAAEDYESALRLEPTSQATAADRRACLNLLYQQEQLQHELPRVPVTPSAQQPVPGTVASPSRQADHQPADALKQTPASTSRTSEQAADLSAHAQQKANVSAEAQQTVSASARQAATSASAPQAATSASTQHQAGRRGQQPIHTQQAAQKPQSPQQPFGRRGMPSCVIEELPNEPDPEPPFNPQPIAASPSSPAAAAPQPRQKQGSKQRGSDSEQGNVSAQADSTASTAGASECASASGEMPSAADTASVGRGGNPASLPSTSTELPLSLSPSQTTAPASQHDPKSNARPVTVVQATAEQQTPGTSAVPAQAGATTSSAAAQAQAAGPDASLSQTSIIQQASSAKDGPTSVRNAAPSPASLGQPTATLSSHSRTGYASAQPSPQPSGAAVTSGNASSTTDTQRLAGLASSLEAESQQLNGHATAVASPSAAAASPASAAAIAQPSSSGLLDVRLKPSIPPPRSGTEFEVSWKRLKGDDQAKEAYLRQLDPMQLPKIFKQSLTPAALCGIATVALGLASSQNDHFGVQLLENLKSVPRFDMIVLSLSRRDKTALKEFFDAAVTAPIVDSMVAKRLDAVRKSYRI